MKLDIAEQKENPLLNRKEVKININSESSTPKKEEIAGKVAALLNTDKDLVVIDKIHQYFGTKKCKAYVKVYDTKEDLEKTEPKEKKEKPKAEEKPPEKTEGKPGEKKAEPKKEEKKAEAPKPEAKKEDKPAEKKEEQKK